MGAGQSQAKSASAARRASSTSAGSAAGACEISARQSRKLSSSLRKQMTSVLQLKSASAKLNPDGSVRANNGKRAPKDKQQPVDIGNDSYYVSAALVSPNSRANNYVTIEQQQQQQIDQLERMLLKPAQTVKLSSDGASVSPSIHPDGSNRDSGARALANSVRETWSSTSSGRPQQQQQQSHQNEQYQQSPATIRLARAGNCVLNKHNIIQSNSISNNLNSSSSSNSSSVAMSANRLNQNARTVRPTSRQPMQQPHQQSHQQTHQQLLQQPVYPYQSSHQTQLAYTTPISHRRTVQNQAQQQQVLLSAHNSSLARSENSENLPQTEPISSRQHPSQMLLQQHQQQQQQQQFYYRNILDNDDHMALGSARRFKSPQQQYQYLNSANAIQAPGQQQQQPQQQPQQQQQQPFDFHYPSSNFNASLAPTISRTNFGPLETSRGQQSLYDRSYSLAGSCTLDGRKLGKAKKSHNPLAALFTNNSNNNNATLDTKHSAHTFHLGRRSNKVSSTDPFAGSPAAQRSCPGSLKRIKSAPLSAQQATYEAMRTIDMYMIRQIARSCMNFEMEQKIELEIRLRELAAQSLLEAQTEIDVLEVEKSLLTSDQRMNCYASQLELQRKQLSNPSLSTDSGRGSKTGTRTGRPDVIGTNPAGLKTNSITDNNATSVASNTHGGGEGSSPSFSSLSNSQSPSKLSPVSGQSADSPSFSSSHRSRTGLRHSSGGSNTLNARQRAQNKRREQLMQKITCLSNINCNMVANNRASISISELRIPLMWRDVDHFKGRGDYKRYAIFCLLKINSQIYDTQLISDVDRQVTDVTFDDLVVFNEIEHNFELRLEVYSCIYLEQFSLSSTPRKLKEKLTSSVSRAMGRRLTTQTASANYTRELQAYDKSYRFKMIASATMRLDDASATVKTYDLVLVSPSAHYRHSTASNRLSMGSMESPPEVNKESDKNTLPLFGHFCAKVQVRPDVFDKNIKTGYLRVASISLPDQGQTGTPASSGRGSESPASTANDSDSAQESNQVRLRSALANKMATLSMSQSVVHWAVLRNFHLHLWPVDERALEVALLRGQVLQFELPRRARIVLNIDKFSRLIRVSNSSLTLEVEGGGCYILGVYCPESVPEAVNQADEMGHWLRAIEQHIYDSHIWGSVLNHYPADVARQQSVSGGSGAREARVSSSKGSRNKRQIYGQDYYLDNGGPVLRAEL